MIFHIDDLIIFCIVFISVAHLCKILCYVAGEDYA